MNSDRVKGAAEKRSVRSRKNGEKLPEILAFQTKGQFEHAKGQARENLGKVKEALKHNKK